MTTTLDTHDMVLVHRVFRRELAALPALVRVAAQDSGRVALVAAHAKELLDFLHHHHSGEDALIWPKLRERVHLEQELVDRMEAQHEGAAALVADAEALLATWPGRADQSEALANVLRQLHASLVEHLDEEERSVLPLIAGCFTQAEWDELGERGFASVPKKRRLVTLGHILQDADADEQRAFLAHVPAPARVAFKVLGRRQHAKEATRLHGPVPQQRGSTS